MITHTVDACPGCGGTSSERVELDSDHELRECTACSLVYAARYADPDEIYVDGYLKGETDFGLDIFHPTFQEFLDFAAGKRLDVIESIAPARGSMLDVGCGSGEVLRAASRRGWVVGGAEPVEVSAAIARERGLDVRTAILQEAGFAEGSWDVVTAFHVLEHMADGAGFLTTLARWARPGGLVVIEVPNWGSVDREQHGGWWPNLRPLEHVAHYTPETLERTFRRVGLEPVLVRSMGFLWHKMTLGERLAALGHGRWRPILRPFSRKVAQEGHEVLYPRALAARALLAAEALYDRRRKGQVVLGLERVPT
jgi:SAM-dependent methyltransferase